MLANLRSEFRKLLTVRSTYFILLIAVALEFLVFWLAKGYKINPANEQLALHNPHFLAEQILVSGSVVGLLAAIVVVLFVTHEYRYSTVMYTLTASKNRSRVFFSKLIVVSVFSLLFGVVFAMLAPLLTKWGLAAHHIELTHQTFAFRSIIWRTLLNSWSGAMLIAMIALIIRNQVGAFAVTFLLPTVIEGLLSEWLHSNSVYLPFSSLGVLTSLSAPSNLSYAHAALVGLAWIVGSGIVAWVLFLIRDAN
jgi:hypothetical protein